MINPFNLHSYWTQNGIVLEMNELCYTVHGPLAEASLEEPFWRLPAESVSRGCRKNKIGNTELPKVGKIVHDEVKFIDKDLQIHHGIRIFSPIEDENGKLLYISVVGLDISERKKAEVNLLKNKALLLEAEKAGKIGGWEFDISTLTQSWTDETFRRGRTGSSGSPPWLPLFRWPPTSP